MVEFRVDERDGVPKLMEVNGRFWGSLPLAIAAGVDFPYLLYRAYRGESIQAGAYELGVTSRWLLPGDILWFASTLRNKPRRLDTIREFASIRDQHYDILSTTDPLPALGAVRKIGRQALDVVRGKRNLFGEVADRS
jgi:predicted ATP-grasp superfamily ATP-dependent carboligase